MRYSTGWHPWLLYVAALRGLGAGVCGIPRVGTRGYWMSPPCGGLAFVCQAPPSALRHRQDFECKHVQGCEGNRAAQGSGCYGLRQIAIAVDAYGCVG